MKSSILYLLISALACFAHASNTPSLVSSSQTRSGRISKSSSKKLISIRGGSSEELSSIDWRYFLAGGICAACSHGITTPIGMYLVSYIYDIH